MDKWDLFRKDYFQSNSLISYNRAAIEKYDFIASSYFLVLNSFWVYCEVVQIQYTRWEDVIYLRDT